MTVKEAIGLLMSSSHLILKGTSCKVYYDSYNNTLKTRQKYEEYECPGQPFDVIVKYTNSEAYPYIIIWFRDYGLNKNN